MKVGPKVPGPIVPSPVDGVGPDEAAGRAGKAGRTRAFAEALSSSRAGEADAVRGAPMSGAVADVVARYGSGELTRAEALRKVAEAAVQAWPKELGDGAARARAVDEMAEVFGADPAFAALLDAAAGGPR